MRRSASTVDDVLDISIDSIARSFFETCRPHPIRTMRQWFEEEIIIPSGPHAGEPWSADTQPVQALLLDIFDGGEFTEHVTCGPAQTGKSVVGYIGPVTYHASELKETVVLGIPGGGITQDKWVDIVNILEASPALRQLIPKTGPGSKGGQVRDSVTLSNGTRLRMMTTGGRNTGRSGYTARVVAVTEMASFSAAGKSNTEADPYRQLQARQRAYDADQKRTYAEGTVTLEGHYPWAARIGAAVALIVMPCPHCEEYVTLDRENLKGFEDAADAQEARENAYLECPKCEGHISDQQRREMVRRATVIYEGQTIDPSGKITGDRVRSNRLFFRYNAAHNLLVDIAEIAVEEWQARQHPADSKQRQEAERQLSQQVWAVPIKPAVIETTRSDASPDETAKRRAGTPRGVLPEDCKYLSCGIDVGHRKLHLTTLAVTAENRLLVVEHSIHETQYIGQGVGMDAQTAIRLALRELRDKLLEGYIEQSTGRLVVPDRIMVDNSDQTETIRAWCAETTETMADKILVVRGKGSNIMGGVFKCPQRANRFTVGIADDQSHYTVLVGESSLVPEVNLNADIWKLRVQAAALAPIDSPGALILHDAPTKEHVKFCRALFSEKQISEYSTGGKLITRMVLTGTKANHHLDSTSYAMVGLNHAGWDYVETQSAAVEFAAAAKALGDNRENGIVNDEERDYVDGRQAAKTSGVAVPLAAKTDDDGYEDLSAWGGDDDDKFLNDPHAHLYG